MSDTKQASLTFKPWNFDKRVLERNVRDEVLTTAEVEEFIKALPDVASKGEKITVTDVDDLDDADDTDAADRDERG